VGVAHQAEATGGRQPQDLLDGGADAALRISRECVEVLGMGEQHEDAEIDSVDGGLVPGEQQAGGERGQVGVGEGGVGDLAGDEVGDDVLARLDTLGRGELRHVPGELHLGHARVVPAAHPADPVRQAREVPAVGVGHAEQLADHGDREREGQVLVQVHDAVGGGVVRGHHRIEAAVDQ